MIRIGVLAVAVAVGSGGTCAKKVRTEPVPSARQEVRYRDGTPIVISRGERTAVAVAVAGDSAGRHELESRVAFLLAVRNLGTDRVEVSEAMVEVRANGRAAKVVPAIDLERTDRDRTWVHAARAFSAALRTGDGAFHAEPAAVTGVAGDKDREDRHVRILQKNTLAPGELYEGLLVVEPSRGSACPVVVHESQGATDLRLGDRPNEYGPGPCAFTLAVRLAGETHTLELEEVL